MKPLLVIPFAAALAFGADEAPQWLRELASSQIPAQAAKVPAVVLLHERTVTVEETGRVIERRRKAVKVLTNLGRREAVAAETFIQGAGKVREMQAWLIPPDGKVQRYGKDRVIESAFDSMSMYQEARRAVIPASGDAAPGSVFGFETVTEEKSIFTQFSFEFQDELPTLASRFRMVLPAGWEAKYFGLRGAKEQPVVDGNTYTWEMGNLPFIDQEQSSSSIRGSVPRIAVNYIPPSGAAVPVRAMKDWNEVGAWKAELADPQAKADGAITAKVKELTAGAADEFAKIRAIGQFTQRVRYIAIQTGLAKGGGYKPHAASEVFAKSYGDCKDKTALTRAMLSVVGIPTYGVSIFSGDRTYVDPKWPSPAQFNHAILAIKVSDSLNAPAAANVDGLGRMLFFDPTDENTPAGNLPVYLQGSYALLGFENGGKLIKMPVAQSTDNRIERTIRFAVSPDGSIKGTVTEKHLGTAAGQARSKHEAMGKENYTKSIERWVSMSAQFSTVEGVNAGFDPAAATFSLSFNLASERYARMMNPRLMLLKPTAVVRDIGPDTNESQRTRALILDSEAMVETIEVDLPQGFQVDEAPEPLKLDKPFGRIESKVEVAPGKLTVKRTIELRHVQVEPAQYAELRQFMGLVRGNQTAPVVLIRK